MNTLPFPKTVNPSPSESVTLKGTVLLNLIKAAFLYYEKEYADTVEAIETTLNSLVKGEEEHPNGIIALALINMTDDEVSSPVLNTIRGLCAHGVELKRKKDTMSDMTKIVDPNVNYSISFEELKKLGISYVTREDLSWQG